MPSGREADWEIGGDYWVGGSEIRQNGVLGESVALGIGGLRDAGVSLDENESRRVHVSICFGSESAKVGVSSACPPY